MPVPGSIAEALRKNDRIVIASHLNPEADAIGSSIALGLALEAMGKRVYLYNPSGAPRNLKNLPRAHTVADCLPGWKPDALVVVDCGDFERIGVEAAQTLADVALIINIDHHSTNSGFGHVKWVDPDASCTGELSAALIDELDARWTEDMALWILAAIMADTGNFQFSNTSPSAFELAGRMVELGARPEMVARNLYGNLLPGNLKLLGMVLLTLEVFPEKKVAAVKITKEMLEETGTRPDDIEGFVEYPRNLEGVEVAVLLREQKDGAYKVSLRSKGEVNVADIAHSFGGGGHNQAAGFTVEGEPEDIKRRIIDAVAEKAGAHGAGKGE